MIEFISINTDKDEICFTHKKNNQSFHISPFRPEMFGSLLYATVSYICNKYDIELVMHGEANMLPFYSLYADRCIVHNANSLYKRYKHKFNKNREVLIEHIQREFNNIIKSDIIFGSRFSVNPTYDNNKILGKLLNFISKNIGSTPESIMSKISYDDIKHYTINSLYSRPIILHSSSKDCLDACIKTGAEKLWFCTHHKPKFISFEEYVYGNIPELIFKDSLWSNRQNIQDIIMDIDANSFLSTQILASMKLGVRFIASGGATTLFQTIPNIKTVHLTIWDYYTLDFNDIKEEVLHKASLSHKLFHVGGILNNSQKIPFQNKKEKITELPIPTYASRLPDYDTNILNYIGHVGDCLIKEKANELSYITNNI